MAARRYGQDVDKPKPRNDAYTGLLGVSFVAMLVGCLLLFLDYNNYESGKPPVVPLTKVPAAVANAPPPAVPNVVQPAPKVAPPAPKVENKVEAPKKEMKKDEMKKDEMKKDAK